MVRSWSNEAAKEALEDYQQRGDLSAEPETWRQRVEMCWTSGISTIRVRKASRPSPYANQSVRDH
jgi:hypothetical protein